MPLPTALAVDAETIALPLDQHHIDFLTRGCKTDEEKAEQIGRAALFPATGRVACIGIRNPDTDRGACFIGEEAVVLREFWGVVHRYQRIVTFNGRGFDIPFIVARSVANGIAPSRKDLMGKKFTATPHCDLAEEFSFWGSSTMRRLTMDAYCRMFGIDSPKRDGVDGSKIGDLWMAGEFEKIKTYNNDDVRANCDLYKIYLKYYA